MSTKKKTTKTTKAKRSPFWTQSFASAIMGMSASAIGRTTTDSTDADFTYEAARLVQMAEKIATIAEARNQ